MSKILTAILFILFATACNNGGNSTKATDTTTINTTTGNTSDGGPNNGLGDTTSYNRMNDTLSKDSVPKK
jgi:hypothetical protein